MRETMRLKRLSIVFCLMVLIGTVSSPAWARNKIDIVVKTVLASQGSEYLDPKLSDLVKELESVFRYSSYRLLNENRLNLALKETGMVSLPGNRILRIRPSRIKGNRVELELVIFKKKKEIFQTVTQHLNRSSIIVGGPRHGDGYLIFSILSSF